MRVRIVIAERDPIVRIGLRVLFSSERDMRIVAEALDGPATLRLVERHRPHVLIIGLLLAGMDPFDLISQAKARCLATLPIVFSRCNDDTSVSRALIAGARAYIPKTAPPMEILKGVREALMNRTYVSSEAYTSSLSSILDRAVTGSLDLYQTLSVREREVLPLCAEGLSSKSMGSRLGISPRTVEAHRANIMRKLGFHKVTEVVRYAVERNILSRTLPGGG